MKFMAWIGPFWCGQSPPRHLILLTKRSAVEMISQLASSILHTPLNNESYSISGPIWYLFTRAALSHLDLVVACILTIPP